MNIYVYFITTLYNILVVSRQDHVNIFVHFITALYNTLAVSRQELLDFIFISKLYYCIALAYTLFSVFDRRIPSNINPVT